MQSSEFQHKAAQQNHVDVSLLYFDMLRRQPDTQGYDNYVAELNSGSPLTTVINGFLNSTEYANRRP
jgi:hypothetical protein